MNRIFEEPEDEQNEMFNGEAREYNQHEIYDLREYIEKIYKAVPRLTPATEDEIFETSHNISRMWQYKESPEIRQQIFNFFIEAQCVVENHKASNPVDKREALDAIDMIMTRLKNMSRDDN